jgi:hypothetical protein
MDVINRHITNPKNASSGLFIGPPEWSYLNSFMASPAPRTSGSSPYEWHPSRIRLDWAAIPASWRPARFSARNGDGHRFAGLFQEPVLKPPEAGQGIEGSTEHRLRAKSTYNG